MASSYLQADFKCKIFPASFFYKTSTPFELKNSVSTFVSEVSDEKKIPPPTFFYKIWPVYLIQFF
jgi:hypothetical protein